MSFRLFDVPTMVAVSGSWVDPEQDRPVLAAIPLLAPLLPEFDSAHRDLVRIGARDSVRTERLKALTDKAQQLDDRHDIKLKGIHGVLSAWADLLDDEVLAQKARSIRDRLFAEGVSGVQRTYLSESGYADMTAQNLTDDIRAHLLTIKFNGNTLAEEVDAWIEAGHELGQVEKERVQLASLKDEESFSASDINKARARWSKVTEALLKLLDLIPDLEDETRIRILEPLQNAEEKIARRRKSNNSVTAEPEQPPEPEPEEAPVSPPEPVLESAPELAE